MLVRVDYKLVIAFVVTIFLFVVMVAITIHNNKENLELSKEMERTNYMMKYLEDLHLSSQNLVNSYLAYSINPSSSKFQNIEESRHLAESSKVELLELSKQNSELTDSVFDMVYYLEAIINYSDQVVASVKSNTGQDQVILSNDIGSSNLELLSNKIHSLENFGRAKLRKLESTQKGTSESAIKRNNIYAGLCLALVITIFTLLQRDMNKRSILEEQLRTFNLRLEADIAKKTQEVNQVFERISDGYFLLNRQGLCTYVNAQGAFQLGLSKNEVLGKHFGELYSSTEAIPDTHRFDVLMESRANVNGEFTDIRTNKIFEYYAYPFNEGMSIFLRDITERKKAREELIRSNEKFKLINEQLRNLSVYLQKVREDERTHIAREIHDELGQILTGIKLDLSWLQSKVEDCSDDAKKRLNATIDLTNSAIKSVRKIATDLRPVILDDFGLIAAIEWQTKQFAERTNLSVHLNLPETEWSFSKDFSTIVFRICQEALTNVARHAHATEVNVSVDIEKGSLLLRIADNGVGINGDKKVGSLGLIGMRERAESMGGKLNVVNLPEGGVLLELKIPYSNEISFS
ncbi:MAG: histidine kinase [Flavobacteriales bacterium]